MTGAVVILALACFLGFLAVCILVVALLAANARIDSMTHELQGAVAAASLAKVDSGAAQDATALRGATNEALAAEMTGHLSDDAVPLSVQDELK